MVKYAKGINVRGPLTDPRDAAQADYTALHIRTTLEYSILDATDI